jgi:hypothetical protein
VAMAERLLSVQSRDLRRDAGQRAGGADSGPSRPHPETERFDPKAVSRYVARMCSVHPDPAREAGRFLSIVHRS